MPELIRLYKNKRSESSAKWNHAHKDRRRVIQGTYYAKNRTAILERRKAKKELPEATTNS